MAPWFAKWGLDHYLKPDSDVAPPLRNIPLTSLAMNRDSMLIENSDPACDSTFYPVGLI